MQVNDAMVGAALEEAAKALDPDAWDSKAPGADDRREDARIMATAAITAYLAQAEKDGWVMVPVEPTEAMWGGLARDLIAWDRGLPNQYGSTLYGHLRTCGREIPDWLLAEIPDINHTPPKGTVAVCIYRAMLAAAQNGGE